MGGRKVFFFCFLLIWLAPENVNVTGDLSRGGASTGVPGTVALMKEILDKYGTVWNIGFFFNGKWSLDNCLKPAIKLAKDGWTLDHYGAQRLKAYANELKRFNSTRQIYFDSNGEPKKESFL
mgnify:CR=1 FL=1